MIFLNLISDLTYYPSAMPSIVKSLSICSDLALNLEEIKLFHRQLWLLSSHAGDKAYEYDLLKAFTPKESPQTPRSGVTLEISTALDQTISVAIASKYGSLD